MFLAVAGSIGSGKTTLTRRLSERLGYRGLYESTKDNPYLADFYREMERWALPLQLRFLGTRVRDTKELQRRGVSVIQDRTCYEDVEIFAAYLHDRGSMPRRDWETYRLIADQLLDDLEPPDLLVYLRRSAEGCRDRVRQRGREYEQSIPADYLVELAERYDGWFEQYTAGRKLLVESADRDFLYSEADLDSLVRQIEAHLPQPLLFR